MEQTRHVDLQRSADFAPEIGVYVAALDDLLKRQKHRFRGMTIEELDWRPAPDMNSAGTLLLHIATVEVSWMCEEVLGEEFPQDLREMRGHRDGMMPPGGLPQVEGEPLDFYLEQLDVARTRTKEVLSGFRDADLVTTYRDAGDGEYEYTLQWILYHLVEHAAYHEGQIGYLRHLRRALTARVSDGSR